MHLKISFDLATCKYLKVLIKMLLCFAVYKQVRNSDMTGL